MEEIRKLVDDLREKTESIGLYMEDVTIASDKEVEQNEEGLAPDIRKLMQEDDCKFLIIAEFGMGEFTFSDANLNPEAVKEEKEFLTVAPTETELSKEQIREKLRKRGRSA